MRSAYDVVVVGAGPYGLSAAAHLRGRGLKLAVFGKPLGMWRDHMPKGMLLRSHWWATNLSDPDREFGLERFCRESKHATDYPLPLDVFVQYGLWFQQQAAQEYGFYANVNPNVDHPRWSQARERRIGEFFKRPTLMFNGYGEQVAQMYAGMDLRKNY